MSTQAQTGAKTVEISPEYQGFVDQCMAKYQPVNAGETRLVRKMAHALWSLHQVEPSGDLTPVDWRRRERSTEIYFRALRELRAIQRAEDKEIHEIHRKQAEDFAAYIRRRAS